MYQDIDDSLLGRQTVVEGLRFAVLLLPDLYTPRLRIAPLPGQKYITRWVICLVHSSPLIAYHSPISYGVKSAKFGLDFDSSRIWISAKHTLNFDVL